MWCLNYSKSNYFSFLLFFLVVSCNSKSNSIYYSTPESNTIGVYNTPDVYESENKDGIAWRNIPSLNNLAGEERDIISTLKLKYLSEKSTTGIKLEQIQILNFHKIPEEVTKSKASILPTPLVLPPLFSGEYKLSSVPDIVEISICSNRNSKNVDEYSKANGKLCCFSHPYFSKLYYI